MKKNYILTYIVAIATICSTPALAQITYTMQPDSCLGKDAHVVIINGISGSGDGNYGNYPEMDVSAWTYYSNGGSDGYIRSFIDFVDLNNIPQGATVSSATLYLYGVSSSMANPQGNSGDNACWVQRVTGTWSENTITWNNQPGTSTTNEATISASTSTWNYNATVNVTSLVQDMVNLSPSQRQGFCIRLKTESYYRSIIFASSDASNAALHPKLVVTFSYCPSSQQAREMVSPSGSPVLKGRMIVPDIISPDKLNTGTKDPFPVSAYFNANKSIMNVDYELPVDKPAVIQLISPYSGQVLKTVPTQSGKGRLTQQLPVDFTVPNGTVIVVRIVQGETAVSKKVIFSH